MYFDHVQNGHNCKTDEWRIKQVTSASGMYEAAPDPNAVPIQSSKDDWGP